MYQKGCLGSAITFSVEDETCLRCKQKLLCQKRIRDEAAIFEFALSKKMDRFDKSEGQRKSVRTELDIRHGKRPRPKASLSKDESSTLKEFQGLDIQAIALKSLKSSQFTWFVLAARYALKANVFAQRDLAEHFSVDHDYNKTTAQRLASRSCKIMTHAGLVKKEGRLYCLN